MRRSGFIAVIVLSLALTLVSCGKDTSNVGKNGTSPEISVSKEKAEESESANTVNSNSEAANTGADNSVPLSEVEPQPEEKNVSPVQADWAGTYIVDYDYEGNYGAIKCEITDEGLIHVTVNFKELEQDYLCEEENYDKAEYVYGTYVSADAKVSDSSFNEHFQLQFKSEPEAETKLHFSYGGHPVEGGDYVSFDKTLEKFSPWHEAPEGYEDKDIDGFISDLDLTDSHMKPATDDYVIYYQDKIGSWNGTDYDYYVRFTIYSFDENGILVDESIKEVYGKEALAQKRYDEEKKYNPRLTVAGDVIYEKADPELYEYTNKFEAVEMATRQWYKGCHYAYSYGYGDEWGHSYCYISKPFTDEIFNMDADAAVYWRPIGSTAHSFRSKDFQGVTFGGDVSKDDYLRLFLWGNYPDGYLRQFHNEGMIRFFGMSAVSCDYASEYPQSGNDKDHFVIYREYAFGKEETVISEYVFKVADFTSHGITFDNFKEKTPDYTWTQHFDMTREAD